VLSKWDKFVIERDIPTGIWLRIPGGSPARAYRRGEVGVKPPIELDILQKLYYLRKGD